MKRMIKPVLIFSTITVLFLLFAIWQNNGLVVTDIVYKEDHISEDLNGFKIVQVSDFHNKKFGRDQKRLTDLIAKQNANIIVVTGDLIDSRRTDIDTAMVFIKKAVEIAPVYYVSGNHEARSNQYNKLKKLLINAGVIILDNDSVAIKHNGSSLNLIGIADPAFRKNSMVAITNTIADKIKADENTLNVLLSHRPELLTLYSKSGVDLVFSGHAHGGQFRIPLIGGLVAPGQGFFPKYTCGTYKRDNTTMVVSRGLGNSIFPLRIFNRPEIVVVTLESRSFSSR